MKLSKNLKQNRLWYFLTPTLTTSQNVQEQPSLKGKGITIKKFMGIFQDWFGASPDCEQVAQVKMQFFSNQISGSLKTFPDLNSIQIEQ